VPGSELYDINGNQLRDGAKWPHKAVDAAILIVVHLFASSCRPNASNERLQREFVYSRVIAPNSIATQFATGRRRRSRRRRASPGMNRAAGWSSFRPRLVGQILGQEPMSKFVRAVSPRIGKVWVLVPFIPKVRAM
jgi:hypothetical protein